MRNPLRRKALTAPAEVPAALRQGWNPIPLLGGGARQRIFEAWETAKSANYAWIYTQSPAVRTVVDCIKRNVGQLELRLYEELHETERQPRGDHPALASMRYPNSTQSSSQYIRTLFMDKLLFDDAFAMLNPAPGQRIIQSWIPAHMVTVQGGSLWQAENYRVFRGDGTWLDVPPSNMLHWHGENPNDPRVGLSKLDALRDVIAEDAALQQAIVELANSGLQEPSWIYRPLEAPDWKKETAEAFAEDMGRRMQRRNEIPVVLEEGMEIRGLGVSPRDAQTIELRKWATTLVANEYGLPLGMIGLSDQIEEARSLFYADCLPPYCEDFTDYLDFRVLVNIYGWTDGRFAFNLDEKQTGDERIKTLTTATGRPVMLTNEGRARLNLPPVPGGDELVTPANVLVGDNPLPSVGVMPIQNPVGPPQTGEHRTEGTTQPPKALLPAVKAANGNGPAEYTPIEHLHPTIRKELARHQRNIETMQGVMQKYFDRLGRSLGATKAAVNWRRWDKELGNDLDKALIEIVATEGSLYGTKLGGHEFDVELVRNYVKAMAQSAAKAINDTVQGEVSDLGVDGAMARGAAHVISAGTSLGGRATNWAREEAARQAPGYTERTKTWVADTERHAEFDGDTVGIGEDWPAGFAPGGAPNCACTMTIQ